jgi:hypothetical protein
MGGFRKSLQYQTLKSYLPYLDLAVFDEASEKKLQRFRRPKDREKFRQKQPLLRKHLQGFLECLDRDEIVSDEVFRSVHLAGELCKQILTRDEILMEDIRSGRAFWGITGIQAEGIVVWDKGDEAKMASTKHPFQMGNKRKSRKR